MRDGKKVADKKLLGIDEILRERYAHAVEVVMPDIYNTSYEKFKNLNRLLAAAHARAIDRVLEQDKADLAVIDQFGKPELVSEALAHRGQGIKLKQQFRGEEVPQVAAASILARAAFLRALKELGEKFAVDLPKGAAAHVDEAGRELVKIHGPDTLKKVAKVHFKNYHRVVNPRFFLG